MKRNFKIEDNMHYCYVYGGRRDLNFHGRLNNVSIECLENEGCTVDILDYKYKIDNN